MAFTDPRSSFGIHSVVTYNRTTKLPHGIIRVLPGTGEINLSANRVDLNGGSNPFPWDTAITTIDTEFTFEVGELPDFIFELFLGSSNATTAAESGGSVTTLTDEVGTTAVDGTTGMDTVTIATAADVKYGFYLILVVTATTVDVYAHSNIDATIGADLTTYTDLMKITASALTVPSGSNVLIPATGIDINGGSGTIAMTIGDSASFSALPIHVGTSTITVGQDGATFPEFGARIIGQKIGNNNIFELHAFRASGAGLPLAFQRDEFSKPELSMKLLKDSTANAVFEIKAVDA